MRFIGRTEELAMLERHFSSDTVRGCAIYGRRRVGKTTLIDRFCEGKPSIRFNFAGSEPDKVMEHISEDISAYTGEGFRRIAEAMHDFDDVVRFLETLNPEERTVVVMDELPDAIALFKDVPASLMRYMDGRMKRQNIFLIICGSSISAMTCELNNADRPLFQRFPVQMNLRPLPYREARLFHPGLSEEDRVRAYAICSGIPLYHEMMSAYDSVEDGIRRMFLGRVPPLYLESRNLIAIEASPQDTHMGVLSAIGNGASDLRAISDAVGLSKSRCVCVLDRLILLGYVEKRVPYGKRHSKVAYRIKDGFMDFCYSVLAGNESLMDMDSADAYSILKGRIETFYGRRFEYICAQYVGSTEPCTWIGGWWGKVPIKENGRLVRDETGKALTEDADIDVVAEIGGSDTAYVMMAECKFSRRQIGVREIRELMHRSEAAMMGGESIRYMLFSRSGFTEDAMDLEADRPDLNIRLVSLKDIGKWAESCEKK